MRWSCRATLLALVMVGGGLAVIGASAPGVAAASGTASARMPPCGPVTGSVVFVGDGSSGETFVRSSVTASELVGDYFWVEAARRPLVVSVPSSSSPILRAVCSYDSDGAHSTLFKALGKGTANVTSSGRGVGTLEAQITVTPSGIWADRIEAVAASGAVYGYLSNPAPAHLAAPVVGIASSPDGEGYWTVGADGGVFSYRDAGFFGSAAGRPLARPVVGIAPDASTGGYWLVGADGGVFSFHAPFFGSASGLHLTAPIVGMAATPDGQGYWLVSADGGVFSFGDARFYGSTASIRLARPVAGIASTADGHGYWLDTGDAGVFAFGDATPLPSQQSGGVPVTGPVLPTPDGGGYWLANQGGGCLSYGDALPCIIVCPSNGCTSNSLDWVDATALQAAEPLIRGYSAATAHAPR